MNKALFLDRDGVLDALIRHQNGEWGAPLGPDQVTLLPGVIDALRLAREHGWLIFVVSNQPDAAKGKTTIESLRAAHQRLLELLGGAPITEFFYCHHRTEDRCSCRKPEPFFVLEAARRHDVELTRSWFVGDTDTDIETGHRAGCRTALVEYPYSSSRRGAQRPDRVCRDLGHFVQTLTAQTSVHDTRSRD